MKKLLKISFISLLLLWTPTLFAQENLGSTRYFDERARGDNAADKYKAAFSVSVCNIALKIFCPHGLSSWNEQMTCNQKQAACGSPITSVAERFISKYGVGTISANREVLPMIEKVLREAKEIEDSLDRQEDGMVASVQNNLWSIAHDLVWSIDTVKSRLKSSFFDPLHFSRRLAFVNIDYWGYFQQSSPERSEYKVEDGIGSLSLAFRWCSNKHRFVNESDRIVSNVLSSVIDRTGNGKGLFQAEDYRKACDALSDETGDQREY